MNNIVNNSPLISICIPSYKNIDFLKRLLDSIAIQTFKDIEIIVTDDSPDDQVNMLCRDYIDIFPLYYFRNNPAIGTPENWNEGIRKARGRWLKIMHDDDWFTNDKSLQTYAEAIKDNPAATFFFSAYKDVFLNTRKERLMFNNRFRYKQLVENPVTLFSKNVVGPPSVTLHLNDKHFYYDRSFKWLVDIDFYIRYFSTTQPIYIPQILVSVGLGSHQVTQDCFLQRPVEIPENFRLLNKCGTRHLKNILVYDAWWRLMRNLKIKDKAEIIESGYSGYIPDSIISMIGWQKRIPSSLLKNGLVSKTLMFISYILNLRSVT